MPVSLAWAPRMENTRTEAMIEVIKSRLEMTVEVMCTRCLNLL